MFSIFFFYNSRCRDDFLNVFVIFAKILCSRLFRVWMYIVFCCKLLGLRHSANLTPFISNLNVCCTIIFSSLCESATQPVRTYLHLIIVTKHSDIVLGSAVVQRRTPERPTFALQEGTSWWIQDVGSLFMWLVEDVQWQFVKRLLFDFRGHHVWSSHKICECCA